MDGYLLALTKVLEEEYAFHIYNITPAQRGFFGETWKIETDEGNYFVKIDYWEYHQESYGTSLFAVAYMNACGILSIPGLRLTADERVYCLWNEGVISVSEYIEGENHEEYPIRDLFENLVPIYKLDTQDLNLEIEEFNTDIFNKYQQFISHPGRSEIMIQYLREKENIISAYNKRLKWLSDQCVYNNDDFCITHGDAGGNCIISDYDFHIIDWDSVKIAPIERDAWFFICDDDKIETIQNVLYENGIYYELNKKYLCYYCYYSFFYYITEYLQSYICSKEEKRKKDLENGMKEYLDNGWIWNQLKKAEEWMNEVMG